MIAELKVKFVTEGRIEAIGIAEAISHAAEDRNLDDFVDVI